MVHVAVLKLTALAVVATMLANAVVAFNVVAFNVVALTVVMLPVVPRIVVIFPAAAIMLPDADNVCAKTAVVAVIDELTKIDFARPKLTCQDLY